MSPATASSLPAVSFRKASSDDLAKIAEHMKPTGETPLYPFTDVDRLRNIPLDGLIVAEAAGEYAGFLYWYRGEKPDFDESVGVYGYIEEVQVVDRFRGHGIGRKMLAYALNQMKETGVEAVYLRTRDGNTPAQNLYESIGFRPYSRHIRYKLLLT